MNQLTNLEITKVAFVDAGANQHADILIYKKAPEPPTKTEEPSVAETTEQKIEKAVAEKVLAIEAELETTKGILAELDEMDNDTLAALKGFEIAKAKPEEDVLKGLPDEVRERIEKAENRVAKMEQERRAEHFAKAAQEYGNVAGADDLAPILEAVDRLDPDVAKRLTPILKAADARIAEGALFSEAGNTGFDSADPFEKVKVAADEIRKANPDLTKAEALQQAMASNAEVARQQFTRS